MTTIKGKTSWFGGPNDTGVSPTEGLAFIYEVDDHPSLFLDEQPSGTTGLARRLDPEQFYIACRWDYDITPKAMLCGMKVMVRAPKTGHFHEAWCADWGPHKDTGRIADISPGLMSALGITTDDEVEVSIIPQQEKPMAYQTIALSSGHGKYVRGASSDMLDEVDEARKVVDALADALRERGVTVHVFHDDVSRDQNSNLNWIVDHHNDVEREIDVSVHFNAFEQTDAPRGVEVLYVTQAELAGKVSAAIAENGFTNRGAKKNTGLFFLNNTDGPAILIETCFVDSIADCDVYGEEFDSIVTSIADVLGGELEHEERPERPPVTPPEQVSLPRVDIEVSGEVLIFINGEQVGTKG